MGKDFLAAGVRIGYCFAKASITNMKSMDYHKYIVRDSKVCGGEPIIKGTRVTVRTVLASLAEGATIEDIVNDFPSLKEEDVRAVIAFAAESAAEDIPVSNMPSFS